MIILLGGTAVTISAGSVNVQQKQSTVFGMTVLDQHFLFDACFLRLPEGSFPLAPTAAGDSKRKRIWAY